jgi:hypothetical protein
MASAVRICGRCQADTKTGLQCSRRTCKTHPYCWQHTQILLGLRVKTSSVPDAGDGLYAVRDFKENEEVAEYSGATYGPGEGPEDSQYLLRCAFADIDARRTDAGLGRYANSARVRRGRRRVLANARLVCDNRGRKARVRVGRRAIRASRQHPKEILVNYGARFRLP